MERRAVVRRAALVTTMIVFGGCVADTSDHRAAVGEDPICPLHLDGCPDAGQPQQRLCRVTGGGQIVEGSRPDAFGGSAQPSPSVVRGVWTHVSHDGHLFVGRPEFVVCFDVAGPPADPPSAPVNAIRFGGTGWLNGERGCTFDVYVEDHGEPGVDDVYGIDISCPSSASYSAGRDVILHGNLQIHQVPPGHR